MKRFILIFQILCWLLPPLYASNPQSQAKDSLLRIYLSTPPDSTRLQALYQIAVLEQQSPTFLYYGDKLLKEATVQKNLHYRQKAIYSHIIYYYNLLDQEHAEQWMGLLESQSEADNSYEYYFKGKKMMIGFYLINQQIELALREAQDMLQKATGINDINGQREVYLCLLGVHFDTAQYKEGIEALNKATELNIGNANPLDKIELFTKGALIHAFLRNNEQLLIYTEQLRDITSTMLKTGGASMAKALINVSLFIEIQYACYYTRNGQAAEAWEHLQAAEKYLNSKSFLPYQLHRLETYAEYNQLIRENDKALDNLNAAIDLITPYSLEEALRFQLKKANLLVDMSRTDEAMSLYQQTAKKKDSLFATFSASQTEQIQAAYSINRFIWFKEHRQRIIYRICLFVAIVFVVTLLLYNLHMYKSRKRLKQDEEEMRRLVGIAEEANEVKSRFLANMSYNIRIPLNNVVGFSQLLSKEDEISEEERNEYTGIIQSNAHELIQLVNDILDLSRLEANMMKFQLQECNLQEWCNDLPNRVQMQSEGNIHLNMQTEISDCRILTDVRRFSETMLSMLIYPVSSQEQRTIEMSIRYLPENEFIDIQIKNSPLADPAFASPKVSIRKKINQLFFRHFGGSWQIEKETRIIRCIYPANQKSV